MVVPPPGISYKRPVLGRLHYRQKHLLDVKRSIELYKRRHGLERESAPPVVAFRDTAERGSELSRNSMKGRPEVGRKGHFYMRRWVMAQPVA